jgi:hypothetical protein
MNEILKLIEERELYVHLILSKVYLSTKGRTNEVFQGNLEADFVHLFGSEFNLDTYRTAKNFLYSENYVAYPSAIQLTVYGRRYFEDFIRNYQDINESEKEILKTELPEKVVAFLGLASSVCTIGDFILTLSKIK